VTPFGRVLAAAHEPGIGTTLTSCATVIRSVNWGTAVVFPGILGWPSLTLSGHCVWNFVSGFSHFFLNTA
jgi:hypothetical protein